MMNLSNSDGDIKVYLSGPMTGHPDHNFPAFIRYKAGLQESGYIVTSPHELADNLKDIPSASYEDFIAKDIEGIIENRCTVWAGMPGWTTSRGALIEFNICAAMGMHLANIVKHDSKYTGLIYSLSFFK